ncbi:hypothetical protein Tco_1217037 [Tanacetum coccineum]
MKRGFRGAPRPLLHAMLLVATNPNAGQEHDAVAQTLPSTSSPLHTFEESSPVHQHFSPPQEQAQGQMTMDDLLQVVPQLISRIDSLETELKQTKLTMGNALVKLVKKVKKLEGVLRRRNVVLSDSEEEEPEAQGRKSQDDPLDSLVQGLVTPSTTKVDASGEEQVEDISPNTLEAAKTLSRVASLKPKSINKGRRYKRRKKTKGKKVVSSLDFQEEVNTGAKQVNTAEGVNIGSIKLSTGSEQDLIREKIEANAELSKSMLGSDLQGEDFVKKMVDLVNQRKKYFAEERARAKRNKPMTQSQLKTYMMNYLKNQGTWKLSQLKNLSFEEVKKEFDKLVKQVESFAPINFEATKASLKRFGEELQTKTSKRLKSDEAKDDEPTKKSGKRRKQMARKGLHKDLDKDDSEDSDEVGEQEESVTGTKTLINPVPVAMKTPSIATYKIIKQGEKGVYQIVREDGTDVVYINFGAMLKDISRDDLTELYRIVMNRYGMDGPEDELEKVFWKYLKNMFEEPLSTDPIWSALGQQRIINKKLQGGKPDENCYKMLKMMEKQVGIRKYQHDMHLLVAKGLTTPELMANDGENLDKMKEKGDACIFVGYSTQSKAYRGRMPTKIELTLEQSQQGVSNDVLVDRLLQLRLLKPNKKSAQIESRARSDQRSEILPNIVRDTISIQSDDGNPACANTNQALGAQVDQGSQIKMIQVKEMMQDNDLKNLKSKDKGSKSRSQSMDEQSHYKQDKTITRQSINVKRHIFNVIGDTEKFEERDLNIGGDC